MNFVPSSEKAKEWGISQRRVAILCKEGRVPGAELVGNRWFLPSDACLLYTSPSPRDA